LREREGKVGEKVRIVGTSESVEKNGGRWGRVTPAKINICYIANKPTSDKERASERGREE